MGPARCAERSASLGELRFLSSGEHGAARGDFLELLSSSLRVIALAARERGEIEAVARESQSVVPLLADVSREEHCARAVAEAMTRFAVVRIILARAG